jgi:hypothetical protein
MHSKETFGVLPKFRPGEIVATPKAVNRITYSNIIPALSRHIVGDWGLLGKKRWRANLQALKNGGRLISLYATERGERFRIITEPDRSLTKVMLADEV